MSDPEPDPGRAAARLRSFHELMPHRVRRILLVTSLYDSFVMSEEGQLAETLLSHFLDLEAGHTPDLVQVSDLEAALDLLVEDDRFDLVVASLHSGDGNAVELALRMREVGISVPVSALAYSRHELRQFRTTHDLSPLERVFLWRGDARVFLAMVMSLEDRLNIEHDTRTSGIPALIVVEDNVHFYSSYLLTIYSELLRRTGQLLAEDLNLSQRMLRMRARPKVLLCTSYEEAWEYFQRYQPYILGVLSDVEFPLRRSSPADPLPVNSKTAGIELCREVLEARPDIRVIIQSSVPENRLLAEELGASFLLKGSPTLLSDLRRIFVERFGFGDFLFRGRDGRVIERASDVRELGEKLNEIEDDSLVHHFERGHFTKWLKARTEFGLAERIEARVPAQDATPEELRAHLRQSFADHRDENARTVIAEFDRNRFHPDVSITRIGSGSLGGKARGVAFANRMLLAAGVNELLEGVDIVIPPSVVLGTDVFDRFLDFEFVRDFVMRPEADDAIEAMLVQAPLPRQAESDLRSFLQRVKYPLAVRSSSLMEDSLSQPFAGVYQTLMLPNNDPDLGVRLRQLTDAVKRVYASTFTERAKQYLAKGAHRLEEEKMAVMIQRLVGRPHGNRFYPDFSGVARSYNYYPEPGHAPEDGVAAVAVGMGKAVVGGDPCLRFCPAHPTQIVGFSSVADALRNSQRELHALDLRRVERGQSLGDLLRLPLEVAEEDGLLTWLGSTFSADDNRIVEGISRAGVRLVSFAQVLRHGKFPLAHILQVLLRCCAEGTGAPVEIEFAGTLGLDGSRPEFAFLQFRPMALSREGEAVTLRDVDDAQLVCRSSSVLGNGRIDDVRDLVVVDKQHFDRSRSHEIALEIARLDAQLRQLGRRYLLIGVGRWGSADPSLGIPVGWNQIGGARAIIEAGFDDIHVAPSQGTHFFQNLTSSSVGYFTVNDELGEGSVDWQWLAGLPAAEELNFARHIELEQPVSIQMNGRTGEGMILKPEA